LKEYKYLFNVLDLPFLKEWSVFILGNQSGERVRIAPKTGSSVGESLTFQGVTTGKQHGFFGERRQI
jgi:hypothetical protein